jgi:hypothetical protein
MYPRKIHDFWISGTIKDDSKFQKSKEDYERLLVQQMRDKGYVPVLDMQPQFNVKYNEEKNHYTFNLVMYGMYIGKAKAFKYVGFSGQSLISRG